MSFLTTDLCDANAELVRVAQPMFAIYGGRKRFCGEIATIKVHEDNVLVRDALSQPGKGKVLVVDGGGSLRCALMGDLIAALAVQNGWEGVVIYGCIRDSVAIGALDIGVRALNTHPLKSRKKGAGDTNLVVTFAGVDFVPGEFLYADEDGIIVSRQALKLTAAN
ncbi:ribonuclease E activity regulator RraA [Parachitinimonas caeni]|uniref:4-hydroxy-4-methyl-2-oxoglutarate aldolase n=1 Tax=Parachitinimonas caeni TaxID=3031301 RepID=A0ABT7DV29_9NEIS|nr:ribonuclease E activity regulator RraA [Parachitinimonas caeni]MDK2123684.1 ribonuclease E activity regulator RraA [Parachitinimonas caeni]